MAVVAKNSSLQILKKMVPLNLLPEEDLEQLLKSAVFKQDQAGGYLFRQGDTDYHNVYLLSGRVALLENMKEVDRVAAGSETARFPLAHQIPRKNSVRALGRVEYVLIDNRKLSEMLVRSKDDDYKVADLSSTISDDWMAQLLQSKVFQQIPPSNIQGVIMRMEEVAVKRGDRVVEQGGEGDYFYLIHQGRCTVSRKEDGRRKATELAKLGPGDSFGEEALLSDSPRNSTVTMLTNGILLRLAKEDFIEFVKRPLAKGVDYKEAEALVDKGAVWLDVRSPAAYESGHIRNSVSFPLETLRYQAPNLVPDQKYVICCDDGQISATAAYLLTDRGFAVSVLEGGLRTAPPALLIKEGANTESRAKVISLRSGEEMADDKRATAGATELDDLKGKLAAAHARIKDLGVKFQSFREKQKREEAKLQAEVKAQKVIIDKNRIRLDELKIKRDADRRLIEQLQQESGDLKPSLDDSAEKLNQARATIIDLEAKLNTEYESRRAIQAERDEHKRELDSHRARLEEATAEKDALEDKVAELQKGQGDVKQQQDKALSESERQIKRLQEELDQARANAGQGEKRLREELEQARADAEQQIRQLSTELKQVQERYEAVRPELNDIQERYQAAQAEQNKIQDRYWAVQSELEEAKNSLQDREAELERSPSRTDSHDEGEVAALREEVKSLSEALKEADLAYDQIREHAEALTQEKEQLLKEMQKLENVGSASKRSSASSEDGLYEDVVSQVFGKAEEVALQQELEDLREASQKWERRVSESDEKCIRLEDALEDRDKEIDKARLELGEEKTRIAEAERQRQQDEETIKQLREQITLGAAAVENTRSGFMGSSGEGYMHDPARVPSSGRSKLLWLSLGAGICFVLLEGAMMFSDSGGLLNGLLGDDETTQVGPKIVGRSTAETMLPSMQNESGVNSRARDSRSKTPAGPKEAGGKQQSAWTVLNDISFGPAMIKLNGGRYIMGSNRNQVSSNEWPAHDVEVKAFAISQHEVTFDEYDRFAKETGRDLPKDEDWGRGNRPVINVSWDDAMAYTKWLSERSGGKYRLPTEAEWEFAVRSGNDSTYWWGYQVEEGRANCFDCGSKWDRDSTAPVGSFPPNNFGLYDMAGNVREWIMDCYQPNYSGAPDDGSAWMETACKERVVRGGAFNKTSDSMRSTWRGHFKPDSNLTFVGFRVVREL